MRRAAGREREGTCRRVRLTVRLGIGFVRQLQDRAHAVDRNVADASAVR